MDKNINTSNQPDDLNEFPDYHKNQPVKIVAPDENHDNTFSSNTDNPGSWITESIKKVISSKEKASITVFDVAEYIIRNIGPMTTMKLQKLVYYSQVWSLVWDEKVLFPEDIQAWANGPVIRELFNFHRGMFHISSVPIGNPDALDENQKETINAVLEFYGDRSSQWLIDLTHQEEPWKKARVGMDISERGNRVIKLEDMAEYYSSLQADC